MSNQSMSNPRRRSQYPALGPVCECDDSKCLAPLGISWTDHGFLGRGRVLISKACDHGKPQFFVRALDTCYIVAVPNNGPDNGPNAVSNQDASANQATPDSVSSSLEPASAVSGVSEVSDHA